MNVVRFKLKSDSVDKYFELIDKTNFAGMTQRYIAKTGNYDYCFVGIWESAEQISKVWQADAHFNPKMPKSERQHHFNRWAKAVDRAGNWDKEDQS